MALSSSYYPYPCAAATTGSGSPHPQRLGSHFQPQNPKLRNHAPKSSSLRLRLNNSAKFETRLKLFVRFASNSNPSSKFNDEEDISTKTSAEGQGQGPPLLTILAGFLVFLLFCWILGSILMWFIGVIVK
ncbi:hypothetical protein CCACVL1_29771 [Corchorus capsularis]|uniref:Uncharacterized protein n=1 Tax=Corchorus capsularis TaxID=210143 RepID=A0A1R3G071_COCAP|nr:hypothetical protein CCACVL1_29771 [Corchorus capsularis]